MDTHDQEIFQRNYVWFNQFFSDLKQLMETISNSLVSKLNLQTKNNSWYYPKLLLQPTIPSYYLTALGSEDCAVQVYAVLDETLFQDRTTTFKKEPSLIVVKHSRKDRVLWPEEYGIRIIRNRQITQSQRNEKVIFGEILAGDGKGTQYFAFQITLDHFAAGKDINAAIQSEIIDVLSGLPGWEEK